MQKRYTVLLCTLLVVLMGSNAFGQLSTYVFQYNSSGTSFDMNSSNTLFTGSPGTGGIRNGVAGPLPIGFAFNFSGTNYTTFSISTNGLMCLGNTVTSSDFNQLQGAGNYPVLSPYWDYMRVSGGVQGCAKPLIHYKLIGSSPSQVLVVEWRQLDHQAYLPSWVTFQVRLYESSNKVEFYYGSMNACDQCNQGYGCQNGSATIGLAASPSDYMAVTPIGGGANVSRSSTNDYFDLYNTAITTGTTYAFVPCGVRLTGRTGPDGGGTVTMANGDTFFNGFVAQVGNSAIYKPFTAGMTDGACGGSMTMTIGGAAAADYYFGTPGTQVRTVSLSGGTVDMPEITFRPTATGVRNATLTLSGPGTFSRTFNLAARAPLVNYTGNIPQGGTALMANGDVLFQGMRVDRHTSQCFTPFMLTNLSPSSQLIDYTLNDPTGQFTISPDTTIGASGGTTSPVICFNAVRFGPQRATLTVNAGGEPRTFTLLMVSAAPGGELRIGGTVLDSTAQLFRNVYGCVGEEVVSIPVEMVNTGFGDFNITGAEFYLIDSVYGQGVPKYPYLRDANENLIRSYDYILTEGPAVAPYSANPVPFPILVPEGQRRTIYLSFIPSRAGKRFAHAIIRTDGEASAGADTTGELVEGILSFDVYGRGTSAQLSDRPGGGLPMALDFGEHRVGEQATRMLKIVNNGLCPLRVNLSAMEIVAGDVDEFEILTKPSSNIDPVKNDLVLAPGAEDQIEIRFTATHRGSRRAGLRLMTSDSTIQIPGITERGVYYVDLFGQGRADLYAEGADLGPALIGGDAEEHKHGVVRVRNTQDKPVTITGIVIEGTDAADFVQDPTKGWPTLPDTLPSGDPIELGIEFAPGSGAPGPREATLKIYLSNGDSIVTTLRGTAGTRTLAANPSSLNFSATSGGQARKTVVIANTGTMPIRITNLTVSNPDFTIGTLGRSEIQPGGFENLEVTFTPQGPGTSDGQLVIESNGTNGPQNVALNGTASTRRRGDDPSGVTTGRPEVSGEIFGSSEEFSVSGVTGVRDASGLTLLQSVPNPGRDVVEIGWVLPAAGQMSLELYDGAGRLVRVLESGAHLSGESRLRVDVSGLANGVYHYRLTLGASSLSRTLTIAR